MTRLDLWPIQPRSRIFRLGIALVVLGLSVILGWKISPYGIAGISVEIFFGGIAVIVLLIAALRNIEFGVFAIMLAAFLVRATLPTGTQSRIPASMVLTALMIGVWIIWMVLRHHIKLVPSPINFPLLGFVLVALFSYPWSWLSWRPEFWQWTTITKFQIAQLGGLMLMVFLPAALILALNVLQDVKWYKWLVAIMAIIAVPELVQRLANKYFQFFGIGITGPGLYHNWLISILIAQVLFNRSLAKPIRILFITISAGWMYWGFVKQIQWVSVWCPPLIALGLLIFMKSKKVALIFPFLILIPVLLAPQYYYDQVVTESVNTDSNRLWLWQTIIFDLTITKAGALLGAGPAGYATYFMTYYPGMAMSAHNNFVDIFAETGVIGFSLFAWFLITTFRIGWRQSQTLQDDFLLAFNNGVLAGFAAMLTAMMLDDWFLPFAYNNGLLGFDMTVYGWILLGAMVGLGRFNKPTHIQTTAS